MSFRIEPNNSGKDELIIDGFENGIANSPYEGIANIRNLNTSYYPGVAYTNYKRLPCTLTESGTFWYAGAHSTDLGDNTGWFFFADPGTGVMTNPIGKAVSPLGLIYIQDDIGQIWKQTAVNSTTFNLLGDAGRYGHGNAGIAYFNNYLVVFGDSLIEWCGDGSGDAGIISGNWNYNSGTGFSQNSSTFTTNFSSTSRIIQDSPYVASARIQKGDTIVFRSTGTLPAPLTVGTTYYVAYQGIYTSIPNALFYVSTSAANANKSFTAGVNSGATSATLNDTWTGTTGAYTIVFSDAEFKSATLTNGATTCTWTGGLSSTVTALFSIVVTLTSDGTGVHTFEDTQSILPLGNITNITALYFIGSLPYTGVTFDLGAGYTPGYYTSPTGEVITGLWKGATGIYNIIMSNGQKVPAQFTNGSASVNFLSTLTYVSGGVWSAELFDNTVTDNKPYVSKVDANLYFADGNSVGVIALSPDPNVDFQPDLPQTYSVDGAKFSLPGTVDTVVDMTDLKNQMVIASQTDIQTWDYVSATTSSPSPVGETIYKIVNLLNNIYILAGIKGNIYISNGYSAQLFYKIPDYVASTFDVVWQFGDFMVHRSKLFFQVLGRTKQTLLDGLISYYTLDGNSNDSIGNNDGIDTNITYNNSYGKINQGALFDGTSNINTGYSLPLTNISMGFWANENAANTGRIFGAENSGSGVNGLAVYFPSTTTPRLVMRNNNINYDMSWGTITTGSWNYYVITISSISGTSLYLNGVLINSNNSAVSYGSANVLLHFGSSGDVNLNFKGFIDEIGIWSRVLSPIEVATLYNAGSGLQYSFGQTNPNILAGIFSLLVSPSQLGESAKGLVMESQNSYGLIPSAGAKPNGLLISNQNFTTGLDQYYSAWSNGAALGGVDYNDSTLWANYEPTIETDIIPLGSILDKRTLGQIMFKLDRQMTTGDFIRVYARQSLTDSYTLVGTSSTNQLSENIPSNLAQSQWIQFMIQFKCAASGSSRIPLRELRIQLS